MECSLIDCGPVSFPAYPDATATARALNPIADKMGRPVDELVTALRTGEIRSMMSAAPVNGKRATVWSAAYVKSLPDDSFLHVEADSRRFPYKDANGQVDLDRLRSQLPRISQSDLTDEERMVVEEKALRVLAANTEANDMHAIVFTDTAAFLTELMEDESGERMLPDESGWEMLPVSEERAGKTFSKANVAALEGIATQIHDLLTVAKGGGPKASEIGPMRSDAEDIADGGVDDAVEPAARSLTAVEMELRRRLQAAEV